MTLSELCRLPGRALWWGLAIAAVVALLLIWGGITYVGHLKDRFQQESAA